MNPQDSQPKVFIAPLSLPPDIDPAVRQLRLAGVICRVGRDIESSRKKAHARPLPLWTMTSAEAASQWHADHPQPTVVDETPPIEPVPMATRQPTLPGVEDGP